MTALLIIDGIEISTGNKACLYRGIHDPENESDVDFHTALIEQFKRQGWDLVIQYIVDEERRSS